MNLVSRILNTLLLPRPREGCQPGLRMCSFSSYLLANDLLKKGHKALKKTAARAKCFEDIVLAHGTQATVGQYTLEGQSNDYNGVHIRKLLIKQGPTTLFQFELESNRSDHPKDANYIYMAPGNWQADFLKTCDNVIKRKGSTPPAPQAA